MGKGFAFGKIVWAVDAFAESMLHDRAVQALRELTRGTGARIEPVYVLTPGQVTVSPEYRDEWERTFREKADKALTALLKNAGLEGLLPHKTLVVNDVSIRTAVEVLLEYAASRGAELVVTATHAKGGLERFLLGSFAETLILASRIPVLAVNPEARAIERVERILFPTDFSAVARKGFEAAVALAKAYGAELTVYHKPHRQAAATFPHALDLYPYLEREARERRDAAEAWAKEAGALGVKAYAMSDDSPGAVGPSIAKCADTGYMSLIMMVARSGPIASVLLGSTTRQVVRNAGCPVLVYREEAIR